VLHSLHFKLRNIAMPKNGKTKLGRVAIAKNPEVKKIIGTIILCNLEFNSEIARRHHQLAKNAVMGSVCKSKV
jgi:hypothetical protein